MPQKSVNETGWNCDTFADNCVFLLCYLLIIIKILHLPSGLRNILSGSSKAFSKYPLSNSLYTHVPTIYTLKGSKSQVQRASRSGREENLPVTKIHYRVGSIIMEFQSAEARGTTPTHICSGANSDFNFPLKRTHGVLLYRLYSLQE